ECRQISFSETIAWCDPTDVKTASTVMWKPFSFGCCVVSGRHFPKISNGTIDTDRDRCIDCIHCPQPHIIHHTPASFETLTTIRFTLDGSCPSAVPSDRSPRR